MKLTELTSADFKKITKLLKQKERLQAQIAKLDSGLQAFEEEAPRTRAVRRRRRKARAAQPKQPVKRKISQRKKAAGGGLKEKIIKELQAAGGKGVHVKILAGKIRAKTDNIRIWFLTTGKRVKEIKKVAPATYSWQG